MVRLKKIVVGLFMLSLLIQCKDDCMQSDQCRLEPDAGPCLAAFTKYYYDKKTGKCAPFTYGGCGGVVPFETLQECENGCHCE
jgi:hypothetical protein